MQSLADGINPGLYNTLFDQHFRHGCGKVELIGNGPSQTLVKPNIPVYWDWQYPELRGGWNYDNIALVRTRMKTAQEQDPCVLIVEAIDEFGIQALGIAFDVDPQFFARHFWNDQKVQDEMTATRMEGLGADFAAYLTSRDGSQHDGDDSGLATSQDA